MKYILYCLVLMSLVSMSYGQIHQKHFQLGKNTYKLPVVSESNITYITFSNSISGPFISDLTMSAGDSLFVKSDVTPSGAVQVMYFIDVDEDDIIDPTDVPIGIEVFFDNNNTPPGPIDLDPAEGTIITLLETETPPSMTVLVLATEGEDSVTGTVTFENPPAAYTLSGHIYNKDGYGIGGAWIFLSDSTGMVGDGSDAVGFYSIPADAGTYDMYVEHMSGMYESFDTTIDVSGNLTIDVTLSDLTSYIRGYVRDENSNPIENIEVWSERGVSTMTDDNGMYILMLPAGSGQFGLNDYTTLPSYLNPQSHFYALAEGDSIVNNSISNFTCYSANSTISGQVLENGSAPSRSYRVFGWSDVLQSNTMAISNPSTGNYTLPAHNNLMTPAYGVSLETWDDNYPWLPGYYPDTTYSYVVPNTTGINFNFIPAETLFTDSFTGNMNPPDWNYWNWYTHGSIDYSGTDVILGNNRLSVQVKSLSDMAGVGIMTRKPLMVTNREYRVLVDNLMLGGTNNSVRIILSDRQWFSNGPDDIDNSLQLIFERNMDNDRQWRLMRTEDGVKTDLWTSADSTGHYILFQFIEPDTLVLKVHGVEDFRGSWGNHLSMAYLFLTEYNMYGETAAPVYFDEIFIGPIGTTSVREIGGPEPRAYSIKQNYPNPFNPLTHIQYEVPAQSRVSIDVYNILGERVSTLVNEVQSAGRYEAPLNGVQLASGVYYYRFKASDPVTGIMKATEVRKAILIK